MVFGCDISLFEGKAKYFEYMEIVGLALVCFYPIANSKLHIRS